MFSSNPLGWRSHSSKFTWVYHTLFDLTISPLFIEAGRELSDMPGLVVALAPRKAARLRVHDQLILYMKLSGNSSLTHAQQQEILNKLSETYFTSSGPITTGLRAVVVRLNDFLLNRNLRGAKDGQVVAVLGLAAIHSNSVLVAHGGTTHSFLFGKDQVQHFDDGQGVRGLGLGKQISPRYYQSTIEPGDMLVFCAEPPASWLSKSLAGGAQSSLEQLRRRLAGQAGMELHAGLVRFQNGKGQVTWQRITGGERAAQGERAAAQEPRGTVSEKKEAEAPVQAESGPLPRPEVVMGQVVPDSPLSFDVSKAEMQSETQPEVEVQKESKPPALSTVEAVPAASQLPEETPPSAGSTAEGKPAAAAVPAPGEDAVPASRPSQVFHKINAAARTGAEQAGPAAPAARPAQSAKPQQPATREKPDAPAAKKQRPAGPTAAQKAGKVITSVLGAGSAARAKTGQAVNSAAAKVFPNRTEPFFRMSPAAMLGLAIFIPLIVVSVALVVYFNAGRTEQMAMNLYYAQQYAERATQAADPSGQRENWNQVILWVRKANQMGESEQGKALQLQAQSALDAMDGIVRVDFQPVVAGGLGVDVNITRMVSTLNDAYLLDESQGRILRMYRTGTGFELDPGFTCGPGKAGSQIVGPLIDMATLPLNNEYHATILGIDAGGNLVYCAPNQTGFDTRPLLPPDTNWGKIVAMTSSGDTLYVLDPQLNAVWFYVGDNGVYEQRPRLFFDSQVPNMSDIVDFAVDQEFLYLLHSDGRMTLCEGSGYDFQPTRCTDPAAYGDSRVGREAAPLRFEDARFIQIQSTQPPDPSLFILDDAGTSIYHFSLRKLNYQRQYRQQINSDFPFPNQLPTSFVITPNRRIIIAFKNQVYFGAIP